MLMRICVKIGMYSKEARLPFLVHLKQNMIQKHEYVASRMSAGNPLLERRLFFWIRLKLLLLVAPGKPLV